MLQSNVNGCMQHLMYHGMGYRFIYFIKLYHTRSWTWMQGACVTHYSRSHKQTMKKKKQHSISKNCFLELLLLGNYDGKRNRAILFKARQTRYFCTLTYTY